MYLTINKSTIHPKLINHNPSGTVILSSNSGYIGIQARYSVYTKHPKLNTLRLAFWFTPKCFRVTLMAHTPYCIVG